ncbi:hypothetical protein L6452_06337 [Arctium lappa]|uniref:Uncharacterized protein n=1 Tax=Arctium lappa TaxID=4217 RepID=A0ACB9EJB6_ARCLA|nr:hypothetical protein L6452_06337 [Arctium lappa]
MAFICGSFHSQGEEDDYEVLWPFPSTSPKKTLKRRHIFGNRSSKNATNPYADRGLDKFEALLADLDHKRQKILTQKGSEDVSMVKFVYRSPNEEVKPIIIKLRHQRKHHKTSLLQTPESEQHQKEEIALFPDKNGDNEIQEGKRAKPASVDNYESKMKKIKCDEWGRMVREWWKPSCYLPLFVMLILVLLMFSGRSFAILCISLGWYLVPIINETLHIQSSRRRRSRRKSTEKVNNKQTKP